MQEMGLNIENKQLLRSIKLSMIVENKTELEEIDELSLVNKNFIGKDLEIDLTEIYKVKNLKSLSIKFFTITDSVIESINKLDNLETIEISMCKFETTKILKSNINTMYIYTSDGINLDNFDLEKLEYIRLENSGLVDIYKLTKFLNLTRLELVNCPIISIPRISMLKKIEELYLQEIDLKFDLEIAGLKNLKFISLNGSKVDDKVSYINKIKEQNKNIKVRFENINKPIQ
jgi:Leucine-rich repeat (LRR) protein